MTSPTRNVYHRRETSIKRPKAILSLNTKLSEILSKTPGFSAFDELISIPTTTTKLHQHDIFKINKIIDDIHCYLTELLADFSDVEEATISNVSDLEWYFEGRENVHELTRNMESIDAIISQLLVIIESDTSSEILTSLLSKFEVSSDLLLDAKKFIITLKKNVDISVNYKEIKESIIKSLMNEIEDCIKVFLRLQKLKLSSPRRELPNFELLKITSKMRISDLSVTNNLSMKSMRLPTFNEFDDALYNEYLDLESRITPLQVSLDILPMKIEEFDRMCSGSLFPSSRSDIFDNFEKLMGRWNYLLNEKQLLKKECLDSKWDEIFRYLIREITAQCQTIIDKLSSSSPQDRSKVTDEVGSTYKLCSNSIILIHKAFQESIISDSSLVALFNETILFKWDDVNKLLTNPSFRAKRPDSSNPFMIKNSTVDKNGLKLFQTRVRSLSPEAPLSNGLGIDLGIDVESTKVPFSIRKEDKIVDIFTSSRPQTLSKDLDFASLTIADTTVGEEPELSTPVRSTSGFSTADAKEEDNIENNMNNDDVVGQHFDVVAYFKKILSKDNLKPSRLPVMVANYSQLKLPTLKKKFEDVKPPTKIPGICASHPVFHSPDHRAVKTPIKMHSGTLRALCSPIRTYPGGRSEDVDDIFNIGKYVSHSRTSSNGSLSGSSLKNGRIPNLAYASPVLNSTSPERPHSSLGSRYEAANLLLTKELRPSWK